MFETGKPKLIIERLPSEVVGGAMPRITIRMKFIDRGAVLKNKHASWEENLEIKDDYKVYKENFDLPVTLQLHIQ